MMKRPYVQAMGCDTMYGQFQQNSSGCATLIIHVCYQEKQRISQIFAALFSERYIS